MDKNVAIVAKLGSIEQPNQTMEDVSAIENLLPDSCLSVYEGVAVTHSDTFGESWPAGEQARGEHDQAEHMRGRGQARCQHNARTKRRCQAERRREAVCQLQSAYANSRILLLNDGDHTANAAVRALPSAPAPLACIGARGKVRQQEMHEEQHARQRPDRVGRRGRGQRAEHRREQREQQRGQQ